MDNNPKNDQPVGDGDSPYVMSPYKFSELDLKVKLPSALPQLRDLEPPTHKIENRVNLEAAFLPVRRHQTGGGGFLSSIKDISGDARCQLA